ncbi:pyrroline-5-carboxylate reductase dimerization-domain-containing protein [Radiomyces spectabilis]|uniref:pyrroline-5-carboxylate reductase dimerization-domain-containing protein n=1 Tax=Radiomyces spectabilis TaxID=64574 RepID=UPI00221EC7D5|nr:pyrroline-5-carboxylate reductase dimerization-domain-containing protein [Radiomyces spectabilis]KAI8388669.1 pyrroline-5-carboxylate reductase dimerization-domain-containing protein [Radiomyces spectabilis]
MSLYKYAQTQVQRLQTISSHLTPSFSTSTKSTMVSASTQPSSARPIISFIGGGNMAEAILGGLQASGHPGSRLRYSEPLDERRKYMQTKYPELVGSADNEAVVEGADVVILAVKPQVLRNVISSLAPSFLKNPSMLLISIAAGISTKDMLRWLNTDQAVSIVRCMPNTPALVGEGAVGLYATQAVSQEQRSTTEAIMRAVAKQVSWVESEASIDTVTGISGSGPAYFFLIMEAMQNAGVAAGLTPEDAKALTLQTCLGAARMAQTSEDDLATLRRKVTSPKGTTEAAIKSLESNGIRKTMEEAVFAAENRARELAEELGQN